MTTPQVTDADRKRADILLGNEGQSFLSGLFATEFARDRERVEELEARVTQLARDRKSLARKLTKKGTRKRGVSHRNVVDDFERQSRVRGFLADSKVKILIGRLRKTEAVLASKEQE